MLINTREKTTNLLKAQEKIDIFPMCSSEDLNIQMIKENLEMTQQVKAPGTA